MEVGEYGILYMALLTMAILTVAILTMTILTMAVLTTHLSDRSIVKSASARVSQRGTLGRRPLKRTAAAAGGDSVQPASAHALGLRMQGVLLRSCRSTGSSGSEWRDSVRELARDASGEPG